MPSGFGEVLGPLTRVAGSIRGTVPGFEVAALGTSIGAAPKGVSPVAHADGCLKYEDGGDKHLFDCISDCANQKRMGKEHT